MAQDNGSGKQNQDRNGASGSNLLLWAGLIVATGLLTIMWVAPYFTRKLSPSDLSALLVVSKPPDQGGPAEDRYVDVHVKEGNKERYFRYSNLSKVVVHDRSFTGRVDVVELVKQGKQLVASDKTYTQGAAFLTKIDATGSEHRKQLIEELKVSGVDFEYDSGPTSWDQHGPLIVFG